MMFLIARRATKRYFAGSVAGLRIGRWSLYILYWAINLILTLTDVEFTVKYVRLSILFSWQPH